MIKRQFGRTGMMVTPLALGGARIADMSDMPGMSDMSGISQDTAIETVAEALRSGINYIDTAPFYGDSEKRLGIALADLAELVPSDLVLATKIGYRPLKFDYSYEQARACLPVSLELLGADRLSVVYIHDVELAHFDDVMNGAFRAVSQFRDEGVIDYIGVSGGPVALLQRYVSTGEFDCFLSHNRYNLLERSAAGLYQSGRQLGLGIVNAAPFGSGYLANPTGAGATHAYQEAPTASRQRANAVAVVCRDFDIPMAQAAVAFSTSSTLVNTTCFGARSPAEVQSAVEALERGLPSRFTAALEAAAPPNLVDDVEDWRTDRVELE